MGPNLDHVGEEERRVLTYASALGKEFDFPLLLAATGLDEERLADLVERLVHKGILRERPGGEHFIFLQEELRGQVYRELTESRARVVHRKIAEAYEKLYPEPPREIVPELGRHFFLGMVHDRSFLYNRRAAALARESLAPEVAAHHLERARADLKEMPGDHRKEEAELLRDLGNLYFYMADDARADQAYEEGLARAPTEELALRGTLLLARAEVARQTEALVAARKAAEGAMELLEKAGGNRRGIARVHRLLSRIDFGEGRYADALLHGEKALEVLGPHGDIREVAHCHIEIGNVLSQMGGKGNLERSLEYYRKSIETLSRAQDYREMARAHNNLAVALGSSDPADALGHLEKARTYAERAHDRRMVGWALFNSVEFRVNLGQMDQAERDNAEARRILERMSDPLALEQVTMNEGILAQHRQRYPEAEAAYRRALAMAQEIQLPPEMAEMRLRLASLYADWGQIERARDEIVQAEAAKIDDLRPPLVPLHEEVRRKIGPPA